MNTISLFVYAAGVIDALRSYLDGIAVLFGTLAVAAALADLGRYIHWDTSYTPSYERPGPKPEFKPRFFKWMPIFLALALFVGFVKVVVPDSKTIYMIAASEVGETIVTSPEARDMLTKLKDRINYELTPKPAEN